MLRSILFLGSALALAAVPQAESQTPTAKKTEPGEVEVTFANGSVVRMTLLPDKLEIDTPYGKLSVPMRDVRRIDFGLHMPEGTEKKIAAAIKRLSSAEFKERDAAVHELVGLGAYAYPALLQVAKSEELETAKRAQDGLAKIRAKVPAKELRISDDDKVVTPRFTIIGRIVTPSIKGKSEYFGEVELALPKLRQVRGIVEARDADALVDAAKYAQPNQWLDTGVHVEGNNTLIVTASGEVDLRPTLPGTQICGPRGLNTIGFAKGGPAKGKFGAVRSYPGTLLGRIGENGDSFVIGDRFEGIPDREGKLYLQIVPSPYDNASSGTYQVKVSVRD